MKRIILGLTCIFYFSLIFSQEVGKFEFYNPSFEGVPNPGRVPSGWIDCGFEGESPADTHSEKTGFFNVDTPAKDGVTYLGLVARSDKTWESVCQLLEQTLARGKTYSFSIDLAQSPSLSSFTKPIKPSYQQAELTEFTTPLVLRVWGGFSPCPDQQLLYESIPVDHSEWRSYEIQFKVDEPVQYIRLEAYYDSDIEGPYCGNILIDNCSSNGIIDTDKYLNLLQDKSTNQLSDGVEIKQEGINRIRYFDRTYNKVGINRYFEVTPIQQVALLLGDLEKLGVKETTEVIQKLAKIYYRIKNEETINIDDLDFYEIGEQFIEKSMKNDGYQYIVQEYLDN